MHTVFDMGIPTYLGKLHVTLSRGEKTVLRQSRITTTSKIICAVNLARLRLIACTALRWSRCLRRLLAVEDNEDDRESEESTALARDCLEDIVHTWSSSIPY